MIDELTGLASNRIPIASDDAHGDYVRASAKAAIAWLKDPATRASKMKTLTQRGQVLPSLSLVSEEDGRESGEVFVFLFVH